MQAEAGSKQCTDCGAAWEIRGWHQDTSVADRCVEEEMCVILLVSLVGMVQPTDPEGKLWPTGREQRDVLYVGTWSSKLSHA
jgi:hypothetical protein